MIGLEQLSGLLTNAKIGSTFLPSNQLFRSYGIGDGPLFKVKMSAYKNTEIKITAKDGKMSVVPSAASAPLAEFEVLHNAPSLNMSHNHTWGSASGVFGTITNLFNKGLAGGSFSGSKIFNLLKGASDIIENGQTQFLTEFNSWGGADVAESYGGNSRPEFTVNFTLLATENPLMEVVLPALMLTYLSYPTLATEKDMTKFLATVKSNVKSGLNTVINAAETLVGATTTNKSVTDITKKAGELLKGSFDSIDSASAGKWRYRMGDAPPYWVVSSSNGIIFLPHCQISNITVNHFGPWIEAPSTTSISDMLSKAVSAVGAGGGAGLTPASIFPNSSKLINENLFKLGQGQSGSIGGYPTYATVSITFRHAFEKIYGEEWLMSMNGATAHFGSTSSASSTIPSSGPIDTSVPPTTT